MPAPHCAPLRFMLFLQNKLFQSKFIAVISPGASRFKQMQARLRLRACHPCARFGCQRVTARLHTPFCQVASGILLHPTRPTLLLTAASYNLVLLTVLPAVDTAEQFCGARWLLLCR